MTEVAIAQTSDSSSIAESLSVYSRYTSIWREIDNDNLHGLASHPQLLTKINELAPNGYSPLFLACLRRSYNIIQLLLSLGADANLACKHVFPLYVCSLKAEVDCAELILKAGADPNCLCTTREISPFHLAASKGLTDLCKLLLTHGGNVNIHSNRYGTPLHVAVSKDHRFITTFLINNGAVLNTLNHEGETPLHIAVRCGFLEIVRLLIDQATLNPSVKDTTEGNTALHVACMYNRETIALLLINKYPDLIYIRNNERQTPLFYGSDSVRTAIKNAFINRKQGFTSAFNSKTFSDIKFMVENKPFFGHRIILKCRCPVMFEVHLRDKEVHLKDIEFATFHSFMHYVYTDIFDVTDKIAATKLMKLAEKYDLVRLKKLCMDLTSKAFVDVPDTTFAKDMATGVNNEELSDVTFLVEGRPLHAHRVVLCQIAYFSSMLEPGKLRESQMKEIPIMDITYDVFEVLIHYAYTSKMEEVEPQRGVEVLQAVDYFQFSEGLRHSCEAYLCTLINKTTVCQLFHLASLCGSLFLKEECFDFIISYYKVISELPEYQAIPEDLKQELADYLQAQTNRKEKKRTLGTRDQNYSLL